MKGEKAPSKKKIPKFAEVKKPLIIGSLVAVIAIAGITIGIIIIDHGGDDSDQEVVFIYGTTRLLRVIDPLDIMDLCEINVVSQVLEGLFDIDVTSPNSDIIYGLAINHSWSSDALNLTCILRQGVEFHDGTQFNATAVKWHFDRIYRLRNNLSYPELWHFPDGKFLINQTQVLGEYTVRFVLNSPYVPFMSLLSSWTSFILSPTSTPEDRFINNNETLVGTGPFIYDFCAFEFVESVNETTPVNVTYSANPHYWGGPPNIDKLIFLRFFSWSDLLEALQSGQINFTISNGFTESELEPFESNSSFIIHEGIPNNYLNWLVMNNELINVTMRKAVSYAFNYSSIIEATWVDDRRATSPIPERTLYHNITDIEIPIYNVSYARQILKDANWPDTALLTANSNISAGNEWELIANSSTPLAIYNYSRVDWFVGTDVIDYTEQQLVEDLKQIGVKIEIVNITYYEWIAMGYEYPPYHRNMINFAYNFWAGDYNDPFTFINYFYMNTSRDNWGQVCDSDVQDWMEQTVKETDPIKRRNLYYNIQKLLIEEVYPSIWLTYTTKIAIYISSLRGWYPNCYRLSFKSVYFD
ncbi:MAG: ABC transporter substrate-binding protein [Candidatus Thorarchaeota archaeon]